MNDQIDESKNDFFLHSCLLFVLNLNNSNEIALWVIFPQWSFGKAYLAALVIVPVSS